MCLSTRGGERWTRRLRGHRRCVAERLLLVAALSIVAGRGTAAERCSLQRIAELPVTMIGLRPTVHAGINGEDAVFIADSGAFFSSLTPSAAEQFHLKLEHSPYELSGVGGKARAWMTTVNTLTIFNHDFSKVPFFVVGNELHQGLVGLLGQNVFRAGDVEYDLANGSIQLIHAQGDCSQRGLAYWANAKAEAYSVIDIDLATAEAPHTKSVAYVNGTRIRVMFDTGAPVSTLDLQAALNAGMRKDTPGVTGDGGLGGIGRVIARAVIAPFDSFKIGDEEIKHTRLRVGPLGIRDTDMLIGADFFLSHHVLVASSQRKLYFTYNGGPVFNLTEAPAAAPAANTAATPESGAGAEAAAAAEQAATTGAPPAGGEASLDASGYARRGAAETSRHDYEHAIADLTRACELAPSEPDYFYQRGMAYWYTHQGDAALADFDQAIKLRPNHVDALLARAGLRTARHDPTETIIADLDAASRAVPKESDVRMRLAYLYREAGALDAAIAEDTKWIDSHKREDTSMPPALTHRCFTRALAAKDLVKALDDCDTALRLRNNEPTVLQDRGLVQLRLGHYDRAIGDFDAALHLAPKYSWALYGRGIAKARKGDSAGSQADIAAATKLAPKLPDEAARYGIAP